MDLEKNILDYSSGLDVNTIGFFKEGYKRSWVQREGNMMTQRQRQEWHTLELGEEATSQPPEADSSLEPRKQARRQ